MHTILGLCWEKLASSTSPQKPPATYTRVNDFGPHTDSIFRRATYTRVYTVIILLNTNVWLTGTNTFCLQWHSYNSRDLSVLNSHQHWPIQAAVQWRQSLLTIWTDVVVICNRACRVIHKCCIPSTFNNIQTSATCYRRQPRQRSMLRKRSVEKLHQTSQTIGQDVGMAESLLEWLQVDDMVLAQMSNSNSRTFQGLSSTIQRI